jgi:exodeoxyribonuclease VII small subunit
MADPTAPDTAPSGETDPDDEGPGYAEALAELETILASLESADLDVDVLGERVARAAELIRRCRARIGAARLQVEQVVSDLDE